MTIALASAPAAERANADRLVAGWLYICCAMIFAMVVIGGVTRLTESGLSIVTWEPIGGALPPLSEADWQRLFGAYQATPQYLQQNHGMTLDAFKGIFWWEFVHRLWGRLIGVVFALPLFWFLATGRIRRPLVAPLVGLLLLGGAQGALGWWMVASGLKDVPWVSPYRLTAHLALALLIYGFTLWIALGLSVKTTQPRAAAGLRAFGTLMLALVSLTIVAGAFVAGLDAGLIYNEFPYMGDGLVPPDYRNQALGWFANMFENHAAVQFHHRVLAITTLAGLLGLAVATLRGRSAGPLARSACTAAAAVAVIQALLGISTLLLHVPVGLAAMHQAGAVLLLSLAITCVFGLRGSANA